ncbi:nucleolar protein 11-like isoform X2 [Agrilus planipennis]|uniref:Nucleolar protein 11-like n=1 Tax=Agrilus planipennis TaxID=224129 RepID=A0A7F5R1T8_AGRPL|nr:nucleolar protein 11-like [Agrilus planipennis]XP_025831810.1 nucleolar protein 11-like isoform X2 [Agrilus planipennis]
MAKLGNYYGLCPLIDHKSLLGITEDSEAGHVIVTLGKNICIKYRIADQKQIHSWRTKDKFSSAVIYDFSSSKYAAVFNNLYIRIWNDGEENIDKLKKYKFTKQIHSLIQCAKQTFVIFKDLSVSELSKALETRKEKAEETKEVEIVDVLYCNRKDEIYIGIISNEEKHIFEWSLFIDGNFHFKGRENLNVRKSVEIAGHVMCHLAVEGCIKLLTLWSDGYMYAYQLSPSVSEDEIKSNKNSIGKRFAILQSLSLKSPVSMVPLNQQYIALYGADWNEEGAVLLLYNTQFKVIQSKVSFKLFTSGSKLWRVGTNLLLGMGHNLAVIPYHLHDEELATLIGSHKEAFVENSNYLESDVTIVDKVQLLDWDTFKNDDRKDVILNGVFNKKVPENIAPKIDHLLEKGRPEAAMQWIILWMYLKNLLLN